MQSYEIIANKLQTILPQGWNKVVFYAEVTDDSYEMFYYIFTSESDEPIQCYDLPDLYEINEDQIDEVFDELYAPLLDEKSELIKDGNQPWTTITLVFSEDGSFNVDYDYAYIDDGFDHLKSWKNKYLYNLNRAMISI